MTYARYKSGRNKMMHLEFSTKNSQYRFWKPLRGPHELPKHGVSSGSKFR